MNGLPATERIRVLHTIDSLDLSKGGPSRTVPELCRHLADHGVEATIRTSSDRGRQPVDEFDLVHDHGLWMRSNVDAARLAQSRHAPLVVSVRGMLEPWALLHRRWRKRVAWTLYQRRLLAGAAMVHATGDAEAASIRRQGVLGPIVLVPNAIQLPRMLPVRQERSCRTALFLSRLHPVKGLMLLIEAWRQARPEGWRLVIVGPDVGGHRATVEQAVVEACLTECVLFAGPAEGENKWQYYRDADLFVLPTHSENFGLVVAEALAVGVPVITTTAAPWSSLVTERCGWWVAPTVSGIANALTDATSRSSKDLVSMGARGAAYAATALSWPTAAAKMAEAYRWVLGRTPAPSTILLSTDADATEVAT